MLHVAFFSFFFLQQQQLLKNVLCNLFRGENNHIDNIEVSKTHKTLHVSEEHTHTHTETSLNDNSSVSQ